MDIKQIRLRNLRMLVREAGTIANLARLSSTAPAYLSQILNSLPTSTGRPRSVGDKLARKLESAMDKPYGWMDQANQARSEASGSAQQVNYVPLIDESLVSSYTSRTLSVRDEKAEHIPVPIFVSPGSFAVRVSTDSMEPKFQNGDIIIIDPDIKPKSKDFVLCLDTANNSYTFKQLIEEGQRHFLKSLNPHYPLQELEAQHKLIGKVVYRGDVL